ncbi:hypothetical protein WA538_003694 [Blastocystis sp. DL]
MNPADNPLAPSDYKEYADTQYWEERYQKSPDDEFEWYYDYDTLKDCQDILEDAVLVVGCGNSMLCEDMALHHEGPIEGIDISQTVIEEMKKKHAKTKEKHPSMAPVEYKVLDATDMGYEHVFNAVVDKGTLDALNCGNFEVVEKLVMSPLIIISQISKSDQIEEFLGQMVVLFDWERFKYNVVVYSAGEDSPAIYVFVKKQRVPGEPFNVDEDLDAIDIEFVDCTNEEYRVCW